jgi:hypothetical protein
LWRFQKAGFFPRQRSPHRVQRYRCVACRRYFSDQTFRTTYWLKRPELLVPVFHRLVGCSGFRQIAREFDVSPQTILGHSARLGRHALLFHQALRPQGPPEEPLALDSFESFEFSQFHPTGFHLLAGRHSHFFHGFTDSERRRSGRMSEAQKLRRLQLERAHGRPDPRAGPKEVTELLALVVPPDSHADLTSDEHPDYLRAVQGLPRRSIAHHTVSSRAARTCRNPLFPVNLLDLLIRHCGANHKRETIAFSKRRQSAAERLFVLLVWRNYMKSFSERRRDASPAMRLGLLERRLRAPEVLAARLFPTRIALPPRWARYYWRQVATRRIPRGATHHCRYAF